MCGEGLSELVRGPRPRAGARRGGLRASADEGPPLRGHIESQSQSQDRLAPLLWECPCPGPGDPPPGADFCLCLVLVRMLRDGRAGLR